MQLTEVRAEHALIAGLFGVALTNWGANIFHSQAFVMGIVALIALAFLTREIVPATLGVYIAAWLLYLQIGAAQGWLFPEVFAQAVDSLTWVLIGYAIYVVVRHGRTDPDTYLNALCGLAVVLAALGLLTYYFLGAAVATLGNQNFLAAFLAIAGLGCYRRNWWVLLAPIVWCLLITNTSTAIAAFLIGSGYLFFRWWGVLPAALLGVGYFLLFKAPSSLTDRVGYWTDAFWKISGSWHTVVFGVGPGIYWTWGNMLHSEYAYIAWNLGLVGLALAAVYVYLSFREINKSIFFAMFLAVLVDGFSNHLLHTAPTAMLAVIILALKDRLRIPLRLVATH